MNFEVKYSCSGIDWNLVASILKTVGMAHYKPEIHAKAFEASHTTVFIFDKDKMIGFGRAISDGAYQAAIYDCAVIPEYQGQKVGSLIMTHILKQLEGCNVLLYAAPGKEGFYVKHGFKQMKTGMARFIDENTMHNKGFI
ncbi:GNAT family N-acetyltransferase [Maridesulfovibrio sp.]|uniref:GNAT family N-acetyltransferase n=1 Tax=Maridesulfovibrio sp. TaxID=2795000 RepID=UPI002A1886BC|nr:GNAT family N-acetyltransferase [Maridesulfovibrio sp.]